MSKLKMMHLETHFLSRKAPGTFRNARKRPLQDLGVVSALVLLVEWLVKEGSHSIHYQV